MSNPVLLSLRRDQTDRLRQAWTLAEARAYEARADAALAAAAYYAAVGARDQAGEATEEAARFQRAAHLTLDIAREDGPGGEAA